MWTVQQATVKCSVSIFIAAATGVATAAVIIVARWLLFFLFEIPITNREMNVWLVGARCSDVAMLLFIKTN